MSRYRRSQTPGGTFFFTLALANREARTLVEHIDRLRSAYATVGAKMPFETVAICILPEHLHAIWTLPPDDEDFSGRWQRIKGNFSRGLPPESRRSESKRRRREKGLWQRRFWEHQIHDEQDLARHVDYIHFNPVKHGLVRRVVDWPYSSFHRYGASGRIALDWGTTGDSIGDFGEP